MMMMNGDDDEEVDWWFESRQRANTSVWQRIEWKRMEDLDQDQDHDHDHDDYGDNDVKGQTIAYFVCMNIYLKKPWGNMRKPDHCDIFILMRMLLVLVLVLIDTDVPPVKGLQNKK